MIAQNLIERAFILTGIFSFNQPVPATELNYAFDTLNTLLGSWKADGLFDFSTELFEGSTVAGQAEYTIGVSGDFVAQRPISIDGAYIRQNGVDYPLAQIDQRLYDTIALKSQQSTFPNYFYYNPTYPNGSIHLYPVPNVSIPIFFRFGKYVSHFATLEDEVFFPPGYEQSIFYALGSELSIIYGNPRQDLEAKAKEYIANIKKNNLNILELGMDTRLPGMINQRNQFNIFTGY